MTDKIKRVDYYYVQVPNQPGQAVQTLAKLKEAKVNLLAFTAFPTDNNNAEMVMVPEKPEAFLKAATTAGLKLSAKKQAFFVQGKDRPGALAESRNRGPGPDPVDRHWHGSPCSTPAPGGTVPRGRAGAPARSRGARRLPPVRE